jgi:hypothetical protein
MYESLKYVPSMSESAIQISVSTSFTVISEDGKLLQLSRMNYCVMSSLSLYIRKKRSIGQREEGLPYSRTYFYTIHTQGMDPTSLCELDGENSAIRGDTTHRQVVSTRVRHLKTVLLRPKHKRRATE